MDNQYSRSEQEGSLESSPLLDSLRDLFSSTGHARDFTGSRYEFIQARVRLLSLLFAVSVLLWIPIDYLSVTPESFSALWPSRLALAGAYFALVFYQRQSFQPLLVRIRLLMLVLLPCLFYLQGRRLLGAEQSELVEMIYSFYPFVIVVQLAIFPLTLIEGLLLCLPVYLCLALGGDNLLGSLWLLSLLSALSCWAQLSQMHMLLRLYRQATRDPLTGLYNRRMLMTRLEEEHSRARRYQRPMSILLFDLDRFKRINDSHGHQAGDAVLKRFAELVETSLRKVDLVGRFGGEEFLAVLPETSSDGAQLLAERIRLRCREQQIEFNSEIISFTTSIGIATSLEQDESVECLVNRADEALYGAKDSGRDRVVVSGT